MSTIQIKQLHSIDSTISNEPVYGGISWDLPISTPVYPSRPILYPTFPSPDTIYNPVIPPRPWW